MATKICCTCKKEKSTDCFSRNKNSKDGLKEYCKECAAIKSAKYRQLNREEINKRKRQAYEESKQTADERTQKELGQGSKVCTVCGVEKPIADFYKRGNGGFYNYCKECANANAKDYHRTHYYEIRAKNKEYVRNHKQEISEYNKQYYNTHTEEVKERARKWESNNKERMKEHQVMYAQRSRSKKLELRTVFTRDDWYCCKAYFGRKCAYCGKESKHLTQDHFIPIQKGGEYSLINIVPACMSCNASKGDKDFDEWYTKQPFYSKEREETIKAYFELVKHDDTERAT